MKSRSMRICAMLLCSLIFMSTSDLFAADKKKVLIGTSLITGGVLLGVHAASNFCIDFDPFPPSSGSDDCGHGQDVEMISGLVMIGTGTFLLIKGLRAKDHHKSTEKVIRPNNQTVRFGFGKSKNGWAGVTSIQW